MEDGRWKMEIWKSAWSFVKNQRPSTDADCPPLIRPEQNMMRVIRGILAVLSLTVLTASSVLSQAMVNETRDPNQKQDAEFAKLYATWTGEAKFGSPLVDHLPLVAGIPTPKDVLGYYIGAPAKLTYYADILKYYRCLLYTSDAADDL